jgi:hypothetical protein
MNLRKKLVDFALLLLLLAIAASGAVGLWELFERMRQSA